MGWEGEKGGMGKYEVRIEDIFPCSQCMVSGSTVLNLLLKGRVRGEHILGWSED